MLNTLVAGYGFASWSIMSDQAPTYCRLSAKSILESKCSETGTMIVNGLEYSHCWVFGQITDGDGDTFTLQDSTGSISCFGTGPIGSMVNVLGTVCDGILMAEMVTPVKYARALDIATRSVQECYKTYFPQAHNSLSLETILMQSPNGMDIAAIENLDLRDQLHDLLTRGVVYNDSEMYMIL